MATIKLVVWKVYCTYFICAQQWSILICSKSNLVLDEMFSVCSDLSETVGDVLSLQVERAHDVILQTAQVHLLKGQSHERAPTKGTTSQGRPGTSSKGTVSQESPWRHPPDSPGISSRGTVSQESSWRHPPDISAISSKGSVSREIPWHHPPDSPGSTSKGTVSGVSSWRKPHQKPRFSKGIVSPERSSQ